MKAATTAVQCSEVQCREVQCSEVQCSAQCSAVQCEVRSVQCDINILYYSEVQYIVGQSDFCQYLLPLLEFRYIMDQAL